MRTGGGPSTAGRLVGVNRREREGRASRDLSLDMIHLIPGFLVSRFPGFLVSDGLSETEGPVTVGVDPEMVNPGGSRKSGSP